MPKDFNKKEVNHIISWQYSFEINLILFRTTVLSAVEPGYQWSEIRLLAGTKLFNNGSRLDCDIRNCIFKKIKGIHTVKMYSQPNHEVGTDKDRSLTVGYLEDIQSEDVEADFIRPDNYYCIKGGVFEVCSDVQGLEIKKVNFPLSDEEYRD